MSSKEIYSCSSEDEVDSVGIISRVFGVYLNATKNDLRKTQEILNKLLGNGIYCLLCRNILKKNDKVWNCQKCFTMLHLSCTNDWVTLHKLLNPWVLEDSNCILWYCPSCSYEIKSDGKLMPYRCFCGKIENPSNDPLICPHSCGKKCSKFLLTFCGHRCTLLCHPGPCPPCYAAVQVTCFCGKGDPKSRACKNMGWSCFKYCRKLLSCKRHFCENRCHPDECGPCLFKESRKCVCGSQEKMVPCGSGAWKCTRKCTNVINCRYHYCGLICHDGDCQKCPNSSTRYCPCGKMSARLPCIKDVPTCNNICDKLLNCKKHKCDKLCHYGECDACEKSTQTQCRCGKTGDVVQCGEEFFCNAQCKKIRNCGRHICNNLCCTSHEECSLPCFKTLNCGQHQCQYGCHTGPCKPCAKIEKRSCNCGRSKVTAFCGQQQITVYCSNRCNLASNCHHEKRHSHDCHYGVCPPCRKICSKVLKCGHLCSFKCHTSVKEQCDSTDAQNLQQSCPPCTSSVEVPCIGNHVIESFKCHETKSWYCDESCGRQLSCTNHYCELPCHEIENAFVIRSDYCKPCTKPCSKARPEGCWHNCPKLCHSNDCDPCQELLVVTCQCKAQSLQIQCHEWARKSELEKQSFKFCGNNYIKKLTCGHFCVKPCHSEENSNDIVCLKEVTVFCLCKNLQIYLPCGESKTNLECNNSCFMQKEKQRSTSIKNLHEVIEDCDEKRSPLLSKPFLVMFVFILMISFIFYTDDMPNLVPYDKNYSFKTANLF